MNQISIEFPIPDDIVPMQEVCYQTWLQTYPNMEYGITVDDVEDRFKNRNSKNLLAKKIQRLLNPTEDQIVLVAKSAGKVVGYCRIIRYPNHNQLYSIYILPGFQGRGIGRRLWQKAKTFFNPASRCIVNVAVYNTKAIRFYKMLGFKVTSKKTWKDEQFRMKSGSIIPEMEMAVELQRRKEVK